MVKDYILANILNIIPNEEYCAKLWKMIQGNYNGWDWSQLESAVNTWNANCKN